MSRIDPARITVLCPCCNAEMVIDIETRAVLHHEKVKPAPPITDLAAEVNRLKNAGAEREQAFQRSLEAERTREVRLDRKFDELLKRAKQMPGEKPLRDIDL